MNRIQFFVLIGLSSLLVIFMAANVYLVRKVNLQQATASALNQGLTQGRDIYQKLTLLARRISAEGQKTPPDQTMKDILTHEQIALRNPDTLTNGVENAAPPTGNASSSSSTPAASSSTTH